MSRGHNISPLEFYVLKRRPTANQHISFMYDHNFTETINTNKPNYLIVGSYIIDIETSAQSIQPSSA